MGIRAKDDQIVFIVDDNSDVREGLKGLLESVGLECQTFSSTKEFLLRKPTEDTSCLVLDIRLPGASGLEFQAQLAHARIDIPIIFITGHGDIPMTVRAMRAGAVEFLTKPLREQDLLEAINVALQRDRARREQDEKLHKLSARFETLNQREREVLSLVTAGLMNKEVAAEIGLSEVTVKVHRHNLMTKLGARSLAELVRMADALGVSAEKNDRIA
jgi:RNA polymerase sigma factor (sigma-70 family)